MKYIKYVIILLATILLVKLCLIHNEGNQNKKRILNVKLGDRYETVRRLMESKPLINKLGLNEKNKEFTLVYENGIASADYIIIYFSSEDSIVTSINFGD